MKSVKTVAMLGFIALASQYSMAREYVSPFTPQKVAVADGYLQVSMPSSLSVEGCADTQTLVLSDDHKYFDSFLSLAMTAFVSGNKLNVAVGSPCLGGNNWPQIYVMMLQN